jgi:hypothetical protein
MSTLAEGILDDLRSFAEELLERGLAAPGAAMAGTGGSRTLTAILRAAETFDRLLPGLLEALDLREDPSRVLVHAARSPVRAQLSRRPGDYEIRDGRLLPRVWEREVPVLLPDAEPLRWALHVRDRIAADLSNAAARYDKWIDEAAINRRGESEYARREAGELAAIAEHILARQESLDRARGLLHRAAGRPVTPRASVPRALPSAASWSSLRRLAMVVLQPAHLIGAHLAELLRSPVETADLPYLYQRWCGVKVLQALEGLGWRRETDAVGPLFLGGRIEFVRDGVPLDLWVEARIGGTVDHPCGLRASRSEATPDYILRTPGRSPLGGRAQGPAVTRGHDYFVLDPTLSTNEKILSGKSKYLTCLATTEPRLIAGAPAYIGPLRVWAASPLDSPAAEIFPVRDMGTCGALPMNPAEWNPKPLSAWLADVTAHAMAWGRRDIDPGLPVFLRS